MKNESQLKTEFVDAIKKLPLWYATRIEDKYRVGVPDILVGVPFGPTLMIEAKLVNNQSFGPSARQWIELQRFVQADFNLGRDVTMRRSLLLGFKEGVRYLCEATEQVTLDDCLASKPGEPATDFVLRFLKHVQ